MWRAVRPDTSRVWKNPEVLKRLSRYRSIIDGNHLAKYLLAKDIVCDVGLDATSHTLWKKHEQLSTEFKGYVESIDAGSERTSDLAAASTFLSLKIELALRILRDCHFCERRCGSDRSLDQKGWCKLGAASRVSSVFLHTGEEAPLVPSGTIFFSSCCLACAFCQNSDISTNPNSGRVVSARELAILAERLGEDGALNINYVGGDPVPNTHTIIGSLGYQSSNITQLWNSSMYGSSEGMSLIADLVDVWLPDFKYGNNECAERLSGVKNYFDIVSRNHLTAYNNGEVIIRHLVLPNHLECCTFPILEWVSRNLPDCMVNIMAQYRPEHRVLQNPDAFADISRRVSNVEMQKAFEKADELGICWEPVS
ncbi:MAG: pyruvate formate lyase-activating protein [Candidatus Thorarchaeota archaeon]|nr:pyruvate formate lyase-activating protein [Candidatus Thorarchaeota archaeon]